MNDRSPQSPPRRARNDRRRARNREALLAAALEVTAAEGAGALSPLRVTDRAALHKRAFYAHFTDAEDCLRAVALHVSAQDIEANLTRHRAAFAATPVDAEAATAAILESLESARRHATLYRALLRCRFDEGALGDAFRAQLSRVYDAWTELMWQLALRHGIGAAHLHEVRHMAEHVVENHFGAIARVLSGREDDLSAIAARLQRHNTAIVIAELRTMAGP